MNKITLFSMAGSSDHNSAKPRPRARSPIYLCSTCHKESEYVVKSQKFFSIFSLVLQIFPIEENWCQNIFFDNLATGHFSGKICFEGHSSGHIGSNDTGLEFVSCLGAEKKGAQTDRHTDFEYYVYIDVL